MTDYKWLDINSTGLRKAICMIAEIYHSGGIVTDEEVGIILHKTTQRSGLKNAPIMMQAVKEIAIAYEKALQSFCSCCQKHGVPSLEYKYFPELNCAKFKDNDEDPEICIGISVSLPTEKDFKSLSNCSKTNMRTILDISDRRIYENPVNWS